MTALDEMVDFTQGIEEIFSSKVENGRITFFYPGYSNPGWWVKKKLTAYS